MARLLLYRAGMNQNPLPEIISDRQVLQRAEVRGDRVTRVQTIRYQGKLTEVSFWHNANNQLLRVTSREV